MFHVEQFNIERAVKPITLPRGINTIAATAFCLAKCFPLGSLFIEKRLMPPFFSKCCMVGICPPAQRYFNDGQLSCYYKILGQSEIIYCNVSRGTIRQNGVLRETFFFCS